MADRLDDLERRIAALEKQIVDRPKTTSDGPLWVLDGLRPQTAGTNGGVIYAGVWSPGASDESRDTPAVEWQYGLPADELLASDWTDAAPSLTALGHPVRLELLKRVLMGTTATRELAEIEDLGTTGQLHHHLRVLVAAGWLRQRQRGDYDLAGPRIIPLLAIITATLSD